MYWRFIYWLKNYLTKNIALISALLLAVNFKAVVNSHIGWPDTYNAFFLLLSLIFSYRIIENSSVKNYLLAGIFLAFRFRQSIKFSPSSPCWFLMSMLHGLIEKVIFQQDYFSRAFRGIGFYFTESLFLVIH